MITVDLVFVLTYFFYGLAFFSMGLTTLMEVFRSPTLREARMLIPLAVFGLVHGVHEWFEMAIGVLLDLDVVLPEIWQLIRIGMLVFSFATLVGYGVQVLSSPREKGYRDLYVGSVMLGIYLVALMAVGAVPSLHHSEWVGPAQIMARYLLATPGAVVASMALRKQSSDYDHAGDGQVASRLSLASIGFGLYGATQFIGPLVNVYSQTSYAFESWISYVIPGMRAMLAVLITWNLIRMTQDLEVKRREAFRIAQEERLTALETLQNETRKRNELRKELLRKTVLLQEEERARVSRELHDDTAQVLTGFNANLAALQRVIPQDENALVLMDRLLSLSEQMSVSIHKLVRDLRPAQLDELGIHSALENLISSAQQNLALSVEFDYNQICDRMDPLVETVIYRVVQESLTNVARYAQDKSAHVSLVSDQNSVQVIIEDHGVGFDSYREMKKGFGLVGLEERVHSLGGQFQVVSEPGGGTRVWAEIPLEKPCADGGGDGE